MFFLAYFSEEIFRNSYIMTISGPTKMGSVEAVAREADRCEQQRGDLGVQPALPGGGAHVQV